MFFYERKDVSMKKQAGTFSQKLDEYIKTKQFRWLRFLIVLLAFITTGCICFLAGFFLNRDDNMIYKSNINAITEQTKVAEITTTPAVTTVPEETTTPPVTTTARPSVNGVLLNSKLSENIHVKDTVFTYTNSCSFENRNSIGDVNIPLTKKSFILTYDGTITAGLDASLITLSADNDARVITVIIPEAKILSHKIDEDSFVITSKNDNIFNPIDPDDYAQICMSENERMEQKAIDNGILESVYTDIKDSVSDYLNSNEVISENYSINFIISRI